MKANLVRVGLGILTVAVFAAPGARHAQAARSSAGGTINIGITMPFTGKFQQYGTPYFRGAQTAANEINASGGVMGRKIHLIPVDTGGDPVDAVAAVRQMLAADHVSMVDGLSGLDWLNALPILNRSKMVSFTHIGTPAIDHLKMPYSFSTGASDALTGAAMAYYAHTKHYKKVALVFDAVEGAQTLIPGIRYAAKKLKMNIVASPSLPIDAPSYSTEISQIIGAHPDAMLMQIDPSEAGTFFQELRTLGGNNIPIVGSDATATSDWINAVTPQQASAEVISVAASASSGGRAGRTFLAQYKKAYGTTPQYLSVNSYDGMIAGALAMVAARSTNPQAYYKYIMDVTTPGKGHTVVYDFTAGKKLLLRHHKVKYFGAGSPMTYNKYHRVTAGFQALRATSSGGTTVTGSIPAKALVPLNH